MRIEALAEWYGRLLDTHGAFIPDADAKRAILAERAKWQAAPKNRTTGVISLQWDRMVVTLAMGSKDLMPGWDDDWNDLVE